MSRRTDTVALVVSEDGDRGFGDPFFAGVLRGVSAELAASGRQFVLMMSSGGGCDAIEQYLADGHVDGAIVVCPHGRDPMPRRLVDSGLPVVQVGRPLSGTSVPHVDADNLGGALLAGRHLITRGRTSIASIAGPLDLTAGIDRLTGWQRAMSESGRSANAVTRADFTAAAGSRAMAELLDAHPDVDAVFAAADIIAVGAIQHLTARGIRVPQDIAVVGFDDSVLAATSNPTLTTVAQPVEEIGRTATRRLLAQLAGELDLPPSILLPTALITRNSS